VKLSKKRRENLGGSVLSKGPKTDKVTDTGFYDVGIYDPEAATALALAQKIVKEEEERRQKKPSEKESGGEENEEN
jgi:hypothetical protein